MSELASPAPRLAVVPTTRPDTRTPTLAAVPTTPTTLSRLAGRRILVLNWRDVHHPQAGGAEQYTHRIARGWAAAGAEVLGRLERGAPVVIGSGRAPGASYAVAQPLVRRLGSSTLRMLTRQLVGGVADTQCGFKFFSGEAAEQVFRRVTADGFAFDVEVLAVARRLGLPVVEVPVRWTDQEGSSFHMWTHGKRVVSEVVAVRAALARMS